MSRHSQRTKIGTCPACKLSAHLNCADMLLARVGSRVACACRVQGCLAARQEARHAWALTYLATGPLEAPGPVQDGYR